MNMLVLMRRVYLISLSLLVTKNRTMFPRMRMSMRMRMRMRLVRMMRSLLEQLMGNPLPMTKKTLQ